jgi:hypothetical protein
MPLEAGQGELKRFSKDLHFETTTDPNKNVTICADFFKKTITKSNEKLKIQDSVRSI